MAGTRRRFFEIVFGALGAALTAAIAGPLLAAFVSPARRRTVKGATGPMRVGKLDELAVDEPRKVDIVSERVDAWDRSEPQAIGAVWLVRRRDDRVDAYSVVCPHLGCPVGWDAGHGVFACPCHDSAFALADGARLKGPSPRGLDPLPVTVEAREVTVTYKLFVLGIPGRKES